MAWFISTGSTFNTKATPLEVPPLTVNAVKWIDSSLYIGGFVGVIFLTLMGDGFGRKNTLAVMIFPQVVTKIAAFENCDTLKSLVKSVGFLCSMQNLKISVAGH